MSGVWAVPVSLSPLAAAALTDVVTRRISAPMVRLAALVSATLLVGQAAATGDGAALVRSVLAASVTAVAISGVWLLAPRHIGLGDVRQLVVVVGVASFCSWSTAFWAVESALMLAGAYALVRRVPRGGAPGWAVPLAPALWAGFLVAVLMT